MIFAPHSSTAVFVPRLVQKRDGRLVSFDAARIRRAVRLAFEAVRPFTVEADRDLVDAVTAQVVEQVDGQALLGAEPSVEAIQDLVERALAAAGHFEVAKAYVLYRAQHAAVRMAHHADCGLSDYIAQSKYVQHAPALQRREVWGESTARMMAMHRRMFADRLDRAIPALGLTLGAAIDAIEQGVATKRVLGSMRAQQFGGAAIEANHARMYNCACGHIDSLKKFSEALWLLLSGTGVGFSVQRHHVAQLPALPRRARDLELPVTHVRVADSIEGWADALDALVMSYFTDTYVEFDYSAIRPRGARLKTTGGRAPGHLPLKEALEQVRRLLNGAVGRHLKPIEAYDILMFAASAVMSGGTRRAATIALFDVDDEEMVHAKTGDWLTTNPQRQFSNNSAVLVRGRATRDQFDALFSAVREFGEPGFYFTESAEYGANPCVEIGLAPTAVVDEALRDALLAKGYQGDVTLGTTVSGWQHCNLSTINARHAETPEAFYGLCRWAATLGTLQAAYTSMPYLGPVTEVINEREALLGVSLCGIMERPDVLLDPAVLAEGARVVKATNAAVAAVLGINPAARTTCVKPEGTASLLLETCSGIHPYHARHYFRRVEASRTEPVFQWFRQHNPHMVEPHVRKPDTTDVLTFPVSAPAGALTRADFSAVAFLQAVQLVQQHWVAEGTAHERYNPGLRHNVSNTVTVREGEWEAVADFIWAHRDTFTGIAMLAASGDKAYAQAPHEEVQTPADLVRWNSLQYQPVDYTQLWEGEDTTSMKDIVACAGGACELV